MADEIGWLDIVKIAAGSGVVSAVVGQGIASVKEWRQKRTTTRIAALRAAEALEHYAGECRGLCGDVATFKSSGGSGGEQRYAMPALPNDVAAQDSPALGPTRLHRMSEFRREIDRAQGTVADAREHDFGGAEALQAAYDGAVVLGRSAFQYAVRMRREFRLPRWTAVGDEDDRGEWFESESNALARRRAAAEADLLS